MHSVAPDNEAPPPAASQAPGRTGPIGVFDSGVGGLSVLQEIRRAMPGETLHYVADSGHAPYGEKSAGYIESRAVHIIEFLRTLDAKAIVVACNTVTGLIIQRLRERFPDLPTVAIAPAVKPSSPGLLG